MALAKGLQEPAKAEEGGACAIIAPKISGVKLSDYKVHPVDEKTGGLRFWEREPKANKS